MEVSNLDGVGELSKVISKFAGSLDVVRLFIHEGYSIDIDFPQNITKNSGITIVMDKANKKIIWISAELPPTTFSRRYDYYYR